MVDFALRLLNVFTAAPDARAEIAGRLSSRYDANGDGRLGADEFRRIFAEAQLDCAAVPEIGSGSTFPVRRTLYAATLYPSFSRNHAQASYQAQEMIAALDRDGDGQVSVREFDGTANPPTQTPEARADALLARYDADAKGYITADDIAAVWVKDASLGNAALASQAIAVFDMDGDARVTRAEMVTGYAAMDKADAIMAVYDARATGAIDIAGASSIASAEFADMPAQFAQWDVSSDGRLSRQELVAGLQVAATTSAVTPAATNPQTPVDSATDPALVAALLMAQYDADSDGAISPNEFATASAAADFTAWDRDGDASLTLDELQARIAEIQQARTIVSQYDTANKGYFDLADLTAAIEPSSVGSVDERARDIMAFWDGDGDGKVTVTDVLRGIVAGGYVGGEQLSTDP